MDRDSRGGDWGTGVLTLRGVGQGREWTREELDEAEARGNFPYRPSDLFLKVSRSRRGEAEWWDPWLGRC